MHCEHVTPPFGSNEMEKMGGATAPKGNYISSIRLPQTYEVPVPTGKPDDVIPSRERVIVSCAPNPTRPNRGSKTPHQNSSEK
ncbi:hypothetical protein LMG27177_04193 [Paraburkholderia fynbosensis]|uniref:Uncharacterized protein n=1 Tax=Paraburkholderia fynbosensis TaxID=1200993 RepID=A0A6J5GBG6_9BURK|nr:hypothetical protein LMG27177_04193 [Paraburkholderia fynbosensis]